MLGAKAKSDVAEQMTSKGGVNSNPKIGQPLDLGPSAPAGFGSQQRRLLLLLQVASHPWTTAYEQMED